MRETSILVLDNKDVINSGSSVIEGRGFSQATADFKASFKNAGTAPKEAAADQEGRGNKDIPDTQGLDLVGEGDQSDELHNGLVGM